MGKMCEYTGPWQPWRTLFPDRREPDTGWTDEGVTGLPSRKVRCPVCKRRIKADVRAGHDGDVIWRIPPHKKRGWWKRRKKR